MLMHILSHISPLRVYAAQEIIIRINAIAVMLYLLNDVLTVRSGHAGSHSRHGWEMFTDDVVRLLNKREDPLVFVFWGNKAKSKISLINNPNHLVLKCAHPSPLSAYTGFFGCKHFSKINDFLEYNKK